MRLRQHVAAAILALLSLVSLSSAWALPSYPGNVARVNDIDVSYQRFMGIYNEHVRDNGIAIGARGDQLELLTRLRKEALELLINQELLIQASSSAGIMVSDEEAQAEYDNIRKPFNSDTEFAIRLETEGHTVESYRVHLRRMLMAKKYLDSVRLKVRDVTDEELEQYYNDNLHRLTLPAKVRVRHVLLSWKPLGKSNDRAALREQLEDIRNKALAGEDFAELAKRYSEDSTRINGGDVGFFRRGEMVPAFEKAAFSLQPGEISEVVETPFGVHFLKLEEREDAHLLPLDDVRQDLFEHISNEKMNKEVEAEYQRLREQAEIKILMQIERPKQN